MGACGFAQEVIAPCYANRVDRASKADGLRSTRCGGMERHEVKTREQNADNKRRRGAVGGFPGAEMCRSDAAGGILRTFPPGSIPFSEKCRPDCFVREPFCKGFVGKGLLPLGVTRGDEKSE